MMTKNKLILFLYITGFLGLSACGGGSGTPAPTGTASSTLSVNSTSPVNGATQKSDFPITAVFSEPVDTSLVNSNSFVVSDGTNPVAGAFSYSDDKTVVIFTPTSDLSDTVNYTATIKTSLLGASSNSLLANVSWNFVAKAKAQYSCTITTPPGSLGLNAYYTKYCDANGMPVIGGNLVSTAALQKAWLQTMNMMKMRQDLIAEMVKQGTKVAIVAEGEGITQIPEYSDLDTAFPLDPTEFPGGWDDRSRGFGATPARPISSGAEENLLCLAGDPYVGESIFIHEFAHSVEGMGIAFTEPAMNTKIQKAYDDAKAAGLYTNTYAITTVYEYWAEGVQNWFNVNLENDDSHNEVNTRAELKTYDPTLHSLISNIFPADWQPACP